MAGTGTTTRAVVIGGGLGGLSAALELARRGFDVTLLERHAEVGGKASSRSWNGYRWDEGPSILVMTWVYRELFEGAGLDADAFLPMRRLDPAFRIVLPDGRTLEIPADEKDQRDAIAAIDPGDAARLPMFLEKVDRFAAKIGRAYCDRIVTSWPKVLASRLMTSATVISPRVTYVDEINRFFHSKAIRSLFHGFPTFSGFDPNTAPASLAIVPWIILREGVWYPEGGGIAAIPRAIARACRELGVEIRTGVEAEAIERDAAGRATGVATSSGFLAADVVVSNSDYVHTHRMLRGGGKVSAEMAALREGRAEPSTSFHTIQMAAEGVWEGLAHHLLVFTEGTDRVYDEVYKRGIHPTDPPIYVNTTSATDPGDAPAGCSNPFVVVNAPARRADGSAEDDDPEFGERYADRLTRRLEEYGIPGLGSRTIHRRVTTGRDWEARFHAFRGSIHGLGASHNIIGGGFRPLPYRSEVPGLYFVGGGVQPGPGMPMVVQSGKIVAERIARTHGRRRGVGAGRLRPRTGAGAGAAPSPAPAPSRVVETEPAAVPVGSGTGSASGSGASGD